MSALDRRRFLKTVATAVPAVAVGACAPAGTATGTSLDEGLRQTIAWMAAHADRFRPEAYHV